MKKLFKTAAAVLMAALLCISTSGCSLSSAVNAYKSNTSNISESTSDKLTVSYIDVGQGDSILVEQGGKDMLIDTGTNESRDALMNYLKKRNVKKLDYLVLTHPHEDHIGGAEEVIKNYDVGSLFMPKATANTKTFKYLVQEMKEKGLKAAQPEPGYKFNVGSAQCMVLGPINVNSKDLNTYSIVLKLTFKDAKFMFTGDSQSSNEKDMIAKGFDLSADVLKLGHHGSHTSTSNAWLDAVKPKYAVVSCGKGNDYGHPHKVTMDKLKKRNIPVYRTDQDGTIVCTTDGKNIEFNCKEGDYTPGK